MHRGCFVWTPTPPLAGRRTPRWGPVRVCGCLLLLARSGRPASRARFGARHLSFGLFVLLLCSAPSELGGALLVGVFAFFALFFFSCAPVVSCFHWFPAPGVLGLGAACLLPPNPPLFFSRFSAFLLWFVFVSAPPLHPSPFVFHRFSLFWLLPVWFGVCFASSSFSSSPPPSPCLLFSFPPPLPYLVFFSPRFSALPALVGVCLVPSSLSAPPASLFFAFVAACLIWCLFPLVLLFLFPSLLPLSLFSFAPPPCVFFWFLALPVLVGVCILPPSFSASPPPSFFF